MELMPGRRSRGAVQVRRILYRGPVDRIVHLHRQDMFIVFAVRLHVVYDRRERLLAEGAFRLHLETFPVLQEERPQSRSHLRPLQQALEAKLVHARVREALIAAASQADGAVRRGAAGPRTGAPRLRGRLQLGRHVAQQRSHLRVRTESSEATFLRQSHIQMFPWRVCRAPRENRHIKCCSVARQGKYKGKLQQALIITHALS